MKKNHSILFIAFAVLLMMFGFSKTQISLFPSIISFNGQAKELEYEMINYKGHAYVPVRYLADHLDAEVKYDEETKSIDIYHLNDQPLKSEINSSSTQDSFTLSLHSEKEIYKVGDTFRIWADFENTGTESIDLWTADPLIHFQIIQHDQGIGEIIKQSSQKLTFQPNDEYRRQLPLRMLAEYNLTQEHPDVEITNIISGGEIYTQLLNQHPDPFKLPAGEYIIKVTANFLMGERIPSNEISIVTEIPIEIQ